MKLFDRLIVHVTDVVLDRVSERRAEPCTVVNNVHYGLEGLPGGLADGLVDLLAGRNQR